MMWLDWLILVAVAGYFLYLLFHPKKTGCCGDCMQCGKSCAEKRK